ncbi:MAG: ABC transporter ATP-binding protein [Leptospiraceae bacterium]|nr:ABC transporter ATP-binding protein [Leptospiraceae bacterium]MCP5499226.1 ABC transporter ATP-binding protein [Leptospiraceae bacterium]
MLELKEINKYYTSGDSRLHVLKNINLKVEKGSFIAIMGPSGSGKTTLLGVAAGLDTIDSGEILLNAIPISGKSEEFLCKLRSEKIGFIFQNFQLIKTLTALENVSLPLYIQKKVSEKEALNKANEMLHKVSMEHRAEHFPTQLSGGEEQRIAIARAFVNQPSLLFADEPTGNLDSKNAKNVMDLLQELHKNHLSTLIIVTHDPKVAELADRVYTMQDGVLEESK